LYTVSDYKKWGYNIKIGFLASSEKDPDGKAGRLGSV
jgi:hypothetical protein